MDTITWNKWKGYLDIRGSLSDSFGLYSKLYLMTTENLLEFINCIDCEDKDILTVAGSGDQAMNVILNGANSVTCFDINPFSFYQVKLKEAAIKSLTFTEFLDFFDITGHKHDSDFNFFDKSLADKVSRYLDDDTLEFIKIIENYSNYSFLNKETFYFDFNYGLSHLSKMSNYMNEESYSELASILNDGNRINYVESDLSSLRLKLDGYKFDLILLSNISDYISYIYSSNPLESYHQDITSLIDLLNHYGTIQVGYIYDYCSYKKGNVFSNKGMRTKVFPTNQFHSKIVTGYDSDIDSSIKDQIITYQKIK